MKFTCQREDLLNAINIVSKAVSSRTTLPILECILITSTKEGIKLTANDMEMGIETSFIEAEVTEEGSIALEAKMFSEIVRKVNGVTVSISTDEKNAAVINCGTSEYNIMGQNGDDFPEIPQVEQSFPYTLKQKDLKDMITKTIFSVAINESKPVLTGELIEMTGTQISTVAVDGYRISYKKAEVSNAPEPIKVIVPAKTLREISKILLEGDENVSLYITDNHILFNMDGNILVSRLINGEFIKYEQTFTNEFKTRIVTERNELISALERASLVSRDARKVPVKIDIHKENIIITSQTEIGSAYEELAVESEGESLKIAFNPKYLIDALRAIDDERISLQFNNPLSPCIIKPEEGEDYKYLVLPLRM